MYIYIKSNKLGTSKHYKHNSKYEVLQIHQKFGTKQQDITLTMMVAHNNITLVRGLKLSNIELKWLGVFFCLQPHRQFNSRHHLRRHEHVPNTRASFTHCYTYMQYYFKSILEIVTSKDLK